MHAQENRIIVVGAGPAGMMAAGAAARAGARVVLVERNDRLGRKLCITGKGRCNLTNACDVETLIANTPRGGKFLYGAFSRFSPQDTMAFFEERGVPLKTERGNRVFPCSGRAADVANALRQFLDETGVSLVHGRAGALRFAQGRLEGVELTDGRVLEGDRVVLATGGLSYPGTGSTGDGYRLAEQAGHMIQPPAPSLVPLCAAQPFCQELQGLTLKNVGLSVYRQGGRKPVYRDFGELLFTHFGLSGPIVLSASAHLDFSAGGVYRVLIDLKPALDEQALDRRVLRDFTQAPNKNFANSLDALLPRKLIPVAVALSRIPPQQKVHTLQRAQRQAFVRLLKALPVDLTGPRSIKEAVVTRGGVSLTQVDPRTMASKLCKGLYFAGEILDADAYTGGFNLQIAFSTGRLAGESSGREITI